jgi:hypothetical protein
MDVLIGEHIFGMMEINDIIFNHFIPKIILVHNTIPPLSCSSGNNDFLLFGKHVTDVENWN